MVQLSVCICVCVQRKRVIENHLLCFFTPVVVRISNDGWLKEDGRFTQGLATLGEEGICFGWGGIKIKAYH